MLGEFEMACPEIVSDTMTCRGAVKGATVVNTTVIPYVPDPEWEDGGDD